MYIYSKQFYNDINTENNFFYINDIVDFKSNLFIFPSFHNY